MCITSTMCKVGPITSMHKHTSVDENVSFQVVTTPKGSVTVVADEVLLNFGQWTIPILIHHHHLNTHGHFITISKIHINATDNKTYFFPHIRLICSACNKPFLYKSIVCISMVFVILKLTAAFVAKSFFLFVATVLVKLQFSFYHHHFIILNVFQPHFKAFFKSVYKL